MTDEAKTVAPEKLFESDEFKQALGEAVAVAVDAFMNDNSRKPEDFSNAVNEAVKTYLDEHVTETLITETPEFGDAVKVAVAAYLDENLPDLVAAAMPETPEAKAERERNERAEQAAADAEAREAEEAEKAAEAAEGERLAAEERSENRKSARKAFVADEKLAKKQPRDQVDYSKLIDEDADYIIVADNGDTYCPDWQMPVNSTQHLDVQKDRGVSVKIPITVSELAERFSFARLTLRKANVKDSPVLRSELVQPFWVGEGRKADFPANSLLFRVIA